MSERRAGLAELVAIMDRLREPGGCPWDRQQTYQSLRGYLIEECYEAAEALDREDGGALREELGDLLFQIVFLSRLAKEEGKFTLDDVIAGIAEKMVRRHPHVFGDAHVESASEVVEAWERIKRRERGDHGRRPTPLLDAVRDSLPPMLKADRLGLKAAGVGFDWERPEQVLDQVEAEVAELREALSSGQQARIAEELGDLLFSAVMLARHSGIDAESALEGSNRKFRRRFGWIERRLADEGESLREAGIDRLERLWKASKSASGPEDDDRPGS